MAGSDRHLLMTTQDEGEAEIVRGLLHTHGIPAQVVSDITHSVYPLTLDGLGEIRIFVPTGSLHEAREVLAAYRSAAAVPDADAEEKEGPEDAGVQGPER